MIRRAASAALAALVLVACGKVGPPVPPEVRLPRAVTDLSASVGEGVVELAWTMPTHRADNSRLRDPGALRVFRYETASGAEPKPAMLSRGNIVGYTEVGTIPLVPARRGSRPAQAGDQTATVDGHRVNFQDRSGLVYGRRYSYVVLTDDAQGRTSPPSPRVTVAYVAPPEAPGNLAADPGDGQVRLTWQAPTRLVNGEPVEGEILYEVLRAPDATAPLTAVTAPITATEMVDSKLENDRTYHYAVRALRREKDTTARGPATARVAATPTVTTAPPAPTDLVAAVAGATVRLSWAASPASSVARYVIYRATPDGNFTRVGVVTAPTTVFVDRDVPPGSYRYTVTAQDASLRVNESERSNEATVTVP